KVASFLLTSLVFWLRTTCMLAQPTITVPIQAELPTMGAGYFSIGDEVVGKCIQYPASAIQPAGGASDSFSLDTFDQSTSIKKEFSLDGSATFGFGLFKGSLSASFMESSQFSKYETYLHLLVQSRQSVQHIDSSKITVPVLEKLFGNQASFLRRCG